MPCYDNFNVFFSEDGNCEAKMIVPTNRESHHNLKICQNNCHLILSFNIARVFFLFFVFFINSHTDGVK